VRKACAACHFFFFFDSVEVSGSAARSIPIRKAHGSLERPVGLQVVHIQPIQPFRIESEYDRTMTGQPREVASSLMTGNGAAHGRPHRLLLPVCQAGGPPQITQAFRITVDP
jgi:hypothetical protein